MISAVILAAGNSRRMGENKLLLPLGNRLIIDWVVRAVCASRIDDIVLVTGRDDERVRRCVSKGDLTVVHNDRYQTGQASSISRGVSALNAKSDACFFVMGDQPFVYTYLINQMIADFQQGIILQPLCGDRKGAPVLFDKAFYCDLTRLAHDQGGRVVIANNRSALRYISWPHREQFYDVDNREDFERAVRYVNRLPDG